jgi:hypothetical protein
MVFMTNTGTSKYQKGKFKYLFGVPVLYDVNVYQVRYRYFITFPAPGVEEVTCR